jgi:hypothetical protein
MPVHQLLGLQSSTPAHRQKSVFFVCPSKCSHVGFAKQRSSLAVEAAPVLQYSLCKHIGPKSPLTSAQTHLAAAICTLPSTAWLLSEHQLGMLQRSASSTDATFVESHQLLVAWQNGPPTPHWQPF